MIHCLCREQQSSGGAWPLARPASAPKLEVQRVWIPAVVCAGLFIIPGFSMDRGTDTQRDRSSNATFDKEALVR